MRRANLGLARSRKGRSDPACRAANPKMRRRAPIRPTGAALVFVPRVADRRLAAGRLCSTSSPCAPRTTGRVPASGERTRYRGSAAARSAAGPRSTAARRSTAGPGPTPAPAPEEWTWLDASHGFLSRGFLWAIVRFDRFFADERDLDLPRARSFVRWRNTLAIRDDGKLPYALDLHVDAVLPSFDRRLDQLRLRFTVATVSPEAVDPLLPPTLRPPDVPYRPHAGLVLSPFESLRAQTDVQTGALLRRPLGWYARTRFRRVQPIGDALLARPRRPE